MPVPARLSPWGSHFGPPGPEHGRAEGLKEGRPADLMPVLGQAALSSQASECCCLQRVGSVLLLCILVRRLGGQINLAEMPQRPLEYLVLGVRGAVVCWKRRGDPLPPVTPGQVGVLQ